MKTSSFLTFLFFTLLSCQLFSQTTTDTTNNQKTYVVTKVNGKKIIGTIISDDGREILINSTKIGKIYISKSEIIEINELNLGQKDNSKKYEATYEDTMFCEKYVLNTSALPFIKKNKYWVLNLIGPEYHYAFSKHFSVGIMTLWYGFPSIVSAKYNFSIGSKLHFGLGTNIGTSGYLIKGAGFLGNHTFTTTIGSKKSNISFSGGYLYFGRNDVSNNITTGLTFSLSGITKISNNSSFIFDSMLTMTQREGKQTLYSTYYSNGNYYTSNYDVPYVKNYTLSLVPSFRKQITEKKSYQLSIINYIHINKYGYTTAPIPMVSWFYKI